MQKTKSASKKLAHSGTKPAAVVSKNKPPREKLQPKSVKPAKKTVSTSAHAAKKDVGGKKKAATSGATKKASAAATPAKKPAVVQVIKKTSAVKTAAAKAAKETAKDHVKDAKSAKDHSKDHAREHGKDHGKDHAKDAKKKVAEPAHAPKAAKASEKEVAEKGKIVKKAGESHVTRKAPEKKAKVEVERDETDVELLADAGDEMNDDLAGEEHLDGADGDADGDSEEAMAEPAVLQAKAPKESKAESKARKGSDEETPRSNEPADDEIVLTDAEGRRYCRVKECDQISTVDGGYCRYHYLLFWRNIQNRKKILSEGKLARYIEELTARYPDKYLELLRKDLRSEKDFTAAIQELEIDESGVDAEFEDEAQNYLDEVRGMGSETSNEREEDF